jgi:starch synthase
MVSRLDAQKGFDVVAAAMPHLLKELNVQFVILGKGDYWAETYFGDLSHERWDRVQTWVNFDPALAHVIEAGSDFFLMPSHFEPCGLNQMYSQRYGTLPIVTAVGGLDDTVENYDQDKKTGTGFKILELTPDSLFDTIGWANWAFYNRPDDILRMRQLAMSKHWGWDKAAREYLRVYSKSIFYKTGQVIETD